MTVEIGDTLGPYEITGRLGAGGMGEVFRARDTKLGRSVAIKVLPDELARDPERAARFEREAKLLASLNHPAIATLYGFEEGVLVMELVEGETLGERIARGPLPLEETRDLFLQIAEGLEAAHGQGVVHRDLKPANLKITPEGRIKILDFGLAKALSPELEVSASASHSPTLTRGTALGAILGTASYMSPEQAKGHSVDKQTDVWAFGCCLFEALTGERPFPGETVAETLARVIEREPDWSRLPASTPRAVTRLLRRCLTKKRGERLRDVGDARLELAEREETSVESAAREVSLASRYGAALAAAAVFGVFAWWVKPEPPPETPSVLRASLSVAPAAQLTSPLEGYYKGILAISPDGERVVFSGERDGESGLYVRELDEKEAKLLPGTSGAHRPFFSPDGRHVAFFAGRKLRRISIDGGNPRNVAEIIEVAHGGAWSDEGTIVFPRRSDGGLFQVAADGGEAKALPVADPEVSRSGMKNPSFLPGGHVVLFNLDIPGRQAFGGRIMSLSFETGALKTLVEEGHYAHYAEPGYLVWATETALMAAPFDVADLELTGPARPVVEDILSISPLGARHFDVSRTGTLVYVDGGALDTDRRLVWVERDGAESVIPLEAGSYLNPRISPTGRYLSVQTRDADDDVWLYDVRRGAMTRQTFAGENYAPVWGPDDDAMVVTHSDEGVVNLHRLELGGDGTLVRLLETDHYHYPTSSSPDGELIAYTVEHPETDSDLWLLALEDGTPRPFKVREFVDRHAMFSPDGRWLAYTSNETGRFQVFVERLDGTARHQASTDGGSEAVWSRDGSELFYRKGDDLLAVRVEVDSNGAIELGTPELLFARDYPRGGDHGPYYDVGADGRFLFMKQNEPFDAREIQIVLNWTEELERD